MPSAPLPGERRRRARISCKFTRWDLIAITLFVLVPLITYGAFALSGHLLATGDNLNQNLPLRALSGQYLRSGHLPLWNPLIWSGTPLLSGWNAGALFPGTWLFAFLPIALAWTINLAMVPALAAVGLYLLLRRLALTEFAATVAATFFAYTGFVGAELVHLGLDQGTALTPWMLLTLDHLFRPSEDDLRRWQARLVSSSTIFWMLVCAFAIAGIILAGDPRAISTGAIVGGTYLVALLMRSRARLFDGITAAAGALILGTLISSIQLVPGIAFLRASQRGTVNLNFFGTGSLHLREIATFLVAPFALGGNGNFGLPVFDGNYNLPEVSVGVGIMALCAFGGQLSTATRSLVLSIRRRRAAYTQVPSQQLGVWYVLVILGILLALGNNTPLGQLLVHLPLYGTERLQNRNDLMMDLGLVVLLATFVDHLQRALASGTSAISQLRLPTAKWLALIAPTAALALVGVELADPIGLQHFLNAQGASSSLGRQLLGYLVPLAISAIALVVLIIFFDRIAPQRVRLLALATVVLEVGLIVANSSYGTAPTSLYTQSNAYSIQLKHLLGGEGRFAIYDPYYKVTFATGDFVQQVGLPDINTLRNTPSIQGYGSLVNGVYQSVTGSHLLDNLNPSVLPSESVNTLDLRIFLAPGSYLENSLGAGQAVPVPSALAHLAPGIPWLNTGPWPLDPGRSTQWQLSAPTTLIRAELLLDPSADPHSRLSLTLMNGAKVVGHATGVPRANHTELIRIPRGLPITTIQLTDTSSSHISVDAITVLTTTHQRLVLNGLLQGYLASPHWVYVANIGSLVAFKNTEIHGLAWLQPATSHTPNVALATSGKVAVTRGAATTPQVMHVTTSTSSILVRSEAYSTGWSATIAPNSGGRSRTVTVHRFGLIQAIDLSPGSWRVTWHYKPKSVLEGLVLSLLGTLVTLALIIVLIIRFRRQRSAAN